MVSSQSKDCNSTKQSQIVRHLLFKYLKESVICHHLSKSSLFLWNRQNQLKICFWRRLNSFFQFPSPIITLKPNFLHHPLQLYLRKSQIFPKACWISPHQGWKTRIEQAKITFLVKLFPSVQFFSSRKLPIWTSKKLWSIHPFPVKFMIPVIQSSESFERFI